MACLGYGLAGGTQWSVNKRVTQGQPLGKRFPDRYANLQLQLQKNLWPPLPRRPPFFETMRPTADHPPMPSGRRFPVYGWRHQLRTAATEDAKASESAACRPARMT